jgi:hypothetical protein
MKLNTATKTMFLVLYIFVLSIILDKIVFFALNSVSEKVYTGQRIGKLNHFLSVKDTANLLVFGSSRAYHHIDVDVLSDNAFNMGVDGKSIAYAATLIKLLPENKKQTVILNVDPYNFFSTNYKGSDLEHLRTLYHKNEVVAEEMDEAKRSNPLQKIYWTIDYNYTVFGLLKNYYKPQYNYENYNGYNPIVVKESQKAIRNMVLESAGKQECTHNVKANKVYLKYLLDIKHFCEENNKHLVLLTSPMFNDNCSADNQLMENILSYLELDYYNFTNFFTTNNSVEYWKDETHLSHVGANLFSEHLKQIIDDRWLSQDLVSE